MERTNHHRCPRFNMAARKGMLVVVAAGNEGNGSWHYISPGDADSVLTVGAVDTLGRVASFSGYGPSSDGQIKPMWLQ